ncbi:hypothetical protein PVK06_025443 [Gossypium arboreum]|uniref:Uncharacterized protein n=1 Tax=Gossypium arboreum TaxID=29729 RepID=A0ABR0PGK5_GOSAR|nr:hypothetical protein PVK06_025443 [Gossypium arboreum]
MRRGESGRRAAVVSKVKRVWSLCCAAIRGMGDVRWPKAALGAQFGSVALAETLKGQLTVWLSPPHPPN